MDAGAEQSIKQPIGYKEGIWYEVPEGFGFGIRGKSSLKSIRYGTMHTIDLQELNLEIVKLKY